MKRWIGKLFLPILELLLLPSLITAGRTFLEINHSSDVFQPAHLLELFTFETYKTFFTVVHPLHALGWGIIGFTILADTFNLFGLSEKTKYDQKESYGSHGTARWQTEKEMKEYYYEKDEKGWFLGHIKEDTFKLTGKYAVHAINNSGELNAQINIVGPPGSKKTTGFLYPGIFHIAKVYAKADEHADLIITDPKSEIFTYTAKYLQEKGYEVRVLDFIHLKYGDQINPIEFITEEKELMELAEGYVNAVYFAKKGSKSSSGDPIWQNGEILLLGALIGFVQQKYPNEPTFEKVSQLLTSEDIRDPELAQHLFKDNGITGAALELYNRFLLLEDKVRSGVVGGLAINLTLFAIDGIKKITNKTTIDIKKLGAKKDKPIALFIFMPDKDLTFSPIINSVMTVILNQLYKTAYLYNNKLANPVYLLLEEIANIGKIPGLQQMLGTMRGRRIYPMMIWQSLAQMKERYGDGWEDMLSMCDTKIYLGSNDQFTSEYISKTLGKTTIRTQGVSNQERKSFMDSSSKSLSYSYHERPLLFPDEVERFDNNKFIMLQRTRHPVQMYKVQYKYWLEDHRICEEYPVHTLPTFRNPSEQTESKDQLVNQDIKIDDKKESLESKDVIPKKDEMNVSPLSPLQLSNNHEDDIDVVEVGEQDIEIENPEGISNDTMEIDHDSNKEAANEIDVEINWDELLHENKEPINH
ncbi:type IV secretory system conjugative DNA transfer family protein [Anoxybacillus rupiensis]|uniref:Type IV secretory system conjugative DNA transfer family protein n=1 Tax=Anoxybacteroides rupiense TaxID=311460 RepID=A0ABD5IYZ3_9BACL|nr:type IV secretory system conjugative DNA transfer family protein [Anoxybacillus rupiensis]